MGIMIGLDWIPTLYIRLSCRLSFSSLVFPIVLVLILVVVVVVVVVVGTQESYTPIAYFLDLP